MTKTSFHPGLSGLLITALLVAFPGCGPSEPSTGDAAPVPADAGATMDAPAAGTCRSTADCTAGEGCVGPNDVACGIPPQEQCGSDQDCQGDSVCHAIGDTCSPDGVGSRCGAPCTLPEECGDGFQCGQDGACTPVPCDAQDFACRPSERCDPASIDTAGPVHGITHGCVTISCTDDGPCPTDTVCVNGYCQDGPGTCSPPVP